MKDFKFEVFGREGEYSLRALHVPSGLTAMVVDGGNDTAQQRVMKILGPLVVEWEQEEQGDIPFPPPIVNPCVLRLEWMDKPPSVEQQVLAAFLRQQFQDALTLALRKNEDYGDAWRGQGWRGNLARVLSKVHRLKNMMWRSDIKLDGEDNLLDLIVLAAMTRYNRDQGNEWGQ